MDNNMLIQLAELTKSLAENENDAETLLQRGRLLMTMGDERRALDDFKRALEIDPSLAESLSGSFCAEGKEERPCKPFSNLNPLGI